MKTFEYKGYNAQGKTCKGLTEAFTEKEAGEKLASQCIYIVNLHEAGKKRFGRNLSFNRKKSAGKKDRVLLYREMSALLQAGLPLSQVFELLIETPELGDKRTLIAGIRDNVRQGLSLAESFSNSGLTVLPFETALVEIGERSGALGIMLDKLAAYLEEQDTLHEKVQTAMIYPAFILIMSIIIMVLMLGVMLPRFSIMFEETNLQLPLLTRFVLSVGKIIGYLFFMIVLLAIPLCFLWKKSLKNNRSVVMKIDRIVFSSPFIGRGYTALVNIRFARTLALLLQSGVSILEGMCFAGRATNSPWLESMVMEQVERLRHGSSFSSVLRDILPLSGSLPGWVQAGEASGDLPEMLNQSAMRYQHQWERLISRFLVILEPVLILFIGLCVLIIALAILMPVMSLNQAMGQ